MARRRPSPRVATHVCVPPKTQVASYFSTRVSLSSSVSTNCRDQHRPRPEVAYPYSHVHRLALTVGEHLLGDPDLLAHGIVDRVPGAPLFPPTWHCSHEIACRLLLRALLSFRAGRVEECLVEKKRAGLSARFDGSQQFGYLGTA